MERDAGWTLLSLNKSLQKGQNLDQQKGLSIGDIHLEGMAKVRTLGVDIHRTRGAVNVPVSCGSDGRWPNKGTRINTISLDSLEQIYALENQRACAVWPHHVLATDNKPFRKSHAKGFLWALGMLHRDDTL